MSVVDWLLDRLTPGPTAKDTDRRIDRREREAEQDRDRLRVLQDELDVMTRRTEERRD